MVRTRGAATFQQQFPLFHALVSGDARRVAAVCTRQEAAKCGPGNLSATMLALVLATDSPALRLIASRAPLDARLSLSHSDGDLHNWLDLAQVTDSSAVRQHLVAGRTALDIAIAQGSAERAMALIAAGASLQPLLPERQGDGQYGSPASVPRHLWDQLYSYAISHYSARRLARAPAAVLPQLAHLALLAGQPNACLEILQAAELPGMALSSWQALTIVVQATISGHVAVAERLISSHGTGLLEPLFACGGSSDTRVVHLLVTRLAEKLDSSQLYSLLRRATKQRGACAAALQSAAEQGLQLTSEDCRKMMAAFIVSGYPARLGKLLLAVTAPLSPSQLSDLARWANCYDRGALLEVLLVAGAPLDAQLVSNVLEHLAGACLAVLLRRGRLPTDNARPFIKRTHLFLAQELCTPLRSSKYCRAAASMNCRRRGSICLGA